MLAFLPWLEIDKPCTVGEFELIPYCRSEAPFGPKDATQATVDGVLEPYWECRGRPVSKATLIRHEGKPVIYDLEEHDIDRTLQLGTLLAFTGLASRDFFSMAGMAYANTEAFEVYIQRISPDGHSVAVSSRRRDGSSRNLVHGDAYVVVRPEYAYAGSLLQLDASLLAALLEARSDADWSHVEEALTLFNLGNSDRPRTRLATELVFLVSAIERRFQLTNGLCKEFRRACVSAWPSPGRIALKDFKRKPGNRGASDWSVLDYWAEELFKCRNDAAHGKLDPSLAAIWSLHEHLLLGAHYFPLVIKLWLKDRQGYALTENDTDRI